MLLIGAIDARLGRLRAGLSPAELSARFRRGTAALGRTDPTDPSAAARQRFFWGAAVPFAVLAAACGWQVGAFIPATGPVEAGLFLAWAAGSCDPEPREMCSTF